MFPFPGEGPYPVGLGGIYDLGSEVSGFGFTPSVSIVTELSLNH